MNCCLMIVPTHIPLSNGTMNADIISNFMSKVLNLFYNNNFFESFVCINSIFIFYSLYILFGFYV